MRYIQLTVEGLAELDSTLEAVGTSGVARWLGRRSLAGGLSLIYASSVVTCEHFVDKMSSNQANSAFCPLLRSWSTGTAFCCDQSAGGAFS